MKKLQGVVFESKAWEIQVDEGMVFVINKRFESEGRYEACTEVTSDMVESFEIKGVKVPKYLREELALLFHEMEALEKQETEMEFVGIESVWFFKGEPERNVRLYKDQYGMFVSYKYRESGIRFMCVKEGVHGGLFITFDPHELSKYRDGRSTLEEYKATLELNVEEMLQKREQELTVTNRQNTTLVMMPHAHFSLIIGKRYTVHYKDAHGEYELADMLYLGHGVQNDVLFFGDSFENILHVDPFKITALWTDILKQT